MCSFCYLWLFPGCHLYTSLTLRTPMSLLQLVRYRLSNHVSCIPQQLSSRQNGELRGYHVEYLLCLLVLSSSVNLLPTRLLTRQEVTNFSLVWDRIQLYPITWIISLLLHSTIAPLWSCVITI